MEPLTEIRKHPIGFITDTFHKFIVSYCPLVLFWNNVTKGCYKNSLFSKRLVLSGGGDR